MKPNVLENRKIIRKSLAWKVPSGNWTWTNFVLSLHIALSITMRAALQVLQQKNCTGVIIHFWIKNKIVVCLWHHDHLGYLPKAKGKRGHGSDEVGAVIRGSLWFDNDYWRYDKTVLWGRWRLSFSRASFGRWSVFHLKKENQWKLLDIRST